MPDSFRSALEFALNSTGRSLRSVAIAAGVSYEQLKNLRQGKAQRTNVDDARKVAHAFGVTLDDFYEGRLDSTPPTIPIAGFVGAGAEIELVDASKDGGELYRIACPPQIRPGGIAAVEVAGDSMSPSFPQGTVLFYRRDTVGIPTEALGHVCVCEDSDGQAWVKQVRSGREDGLYSLLSINPEAENRHGVRLKWAAPVKFSLPPEFVIRVD